MNNRTVTLTLAASRTTVFSFLTSLRNYPAWASQTCLALREEGTHWRALTPYGELFFEIESHAHFGVIDFRSGLCLDAMETTPVRIIDLPGGGCAVSFTFFHAPDVPIELYEKQYQALLNDLRGLVTRFGGGEVHAPVPAAATFYPNLVTGRFTETWDFYTALLGFRTIFECDTYVHLMHPRSGAQLGLLREEADGCATQPEVVNATDGRGFWVSLDVADADAEHARLMAAGVEIVQPPEDHAWGERNFIVRDPNGVLIIIAHRTAHFSEATQCEAELV
jgi:catechol 2,3-dioxygenase-like lactoylglutathione lyase family enzyme